MQGRSKPSFFFFFFFSLSFGWASFLHWLFLFYFILQSLSVPLPPSLSFSHGSISHGHIEGPGLLKWTLVSFTSYTLHSYTLSTLHSHTCFTISLSLTWIFLTWRVTAPLTVPHCVRSIVQTNVTTLWDMSDRMVKHFLSIFCSKIFHWKWVFSGWLK